MTNLIRNLGTLLVVPLLPVVAPSRIPRNASDPDLDALIQPYVTCPGCVGNSLHNEACLTLDGEGYGQ